MNIPFVDLKAQYHGLKEEMDRAIAEVVENTAFVGGARVAAFEKQFAAYVESEHCVSCANGTEAIEIALRALGIGPGDEVLVPANSFIATSEAVTAAGATVVFVDNEPRHYTIDLEDAARKITSRTRAIIPVHLYGHPADMDAVLALAAEHGLRVVEDTAQAHGARYRGRRVGSIGDAGTFSFYPGKNLGAYGDGGAMVFRDEEVAARARLIANHGSVVKYHHEVEGRNSRLDGIQAAVLSVKLPHLDAWNRLRREHAAAYSKLLAEFDGVEIPLVADWAEPVFHLYVVRVADRDGLQKRLGDRGVATGIHYPIALPLLEAYRHLGHTADDFPVAAAQTPRLLSLPMFAELTDDMIAHVAEAMARETALTSA